MNIPAMGAQFSKNGAKGEAAAEKPGEAVAASPSKANGQVRGDRDGWIFSGGGGNPPSGIVFISAFPFLLVRTVWLLKTCLALLTFNRKDWLLGTVVQWLFFKPHFMHSTVGRGG